MAHAGTAAPFTPVSFRLDPGKSPVLSQTDKHQCSTCGKSFDRKDTLVRHYQIHNENRGPRIARKKACVPCFRAKIKCLAEVPCCSACKRREIECHYNSVPRSALPPVQTTHRKPQGVAPVSADLDIVANSSVAMPATEIALPSSSSAECIGDPGFLDRAHDGAWGDLDNREGSWLNGSTMSLDHKVFDSMFQDTFLNTDLDWSNSFYSDFLFPSMLNSSQTPISDSPFERMSRPGTDESIAEGGNSDLSYLPTPSEEPYVGPGERWSWVMEKPGVHTPRLVLPLLSGLEDDVAESKYYPTLSISEAVRSRLQDTLRIPLDRGPWQTVSLENFPSCTKLEHCIDAYFIHVHPIFPLIHRPTFDASREPLVTLMMVCIGVCYTQMSGAQPLSVALSELVRRVLCMTTEYDPRLVPTESYVTAQVLHGMHGYCVGNKRLYTCTESLRATVVNNARAMSLFNYRPPPPPSPDHRSLEERWHSWIAQERLRRLAWSLYEHDTLPSFFRHTPYVISIGEMIVDLPNSTAHWEADTAQSWAALHPMARIPKSISFHPTVTAFLEGTPDIVDKVDDDQHVYLVILTLVRLLGTVKESDRFSLGDTGFGQESQQKTTKILAALDFVQASSTQLASASACTQQQLMQIVRRSQTINLAHMYGAGDLMDWVYRILRDGPQVAALREGLLRWALQDPARARGVVFHAAQAIAVARCYPFNTPMEINAIFHAGLVLWCMVDMLSCIQQAIPSETMPHLRLDLLPKQDNGEYMRSIESWIQGGQMTVLSLFRVPDMGSKMGKKLILELVIDLLKRNRVWGVSQNFMVVIVELLQHSDETF